MKISQCGCKRKTITVTHLLFIPLPLSPDLYKYFSWSVNSDFRDTINLIQPVIKIIVDHIINQMSVFVIHINPLSFSVYKYLKNPDPDRQSE
ncbi:hypothetical protein A8F91_24535 [Escherichia coli]|nr:hypothetical protein A8F91_24535 [Escherichia coli]